MPPPAVGKLTPESFAALIAPYLGARRAEVLVGPRAGCDCAIVRVAEGRVMAVTTDPLSLVPALGPERSARLACHLLASDLWTTGIAPQFATVSLHLPPGMDDATLGAYSRALSEEWAKLGVAVVAGHTGRYDGCDLTIVGAATLIGLGDEARYLSPAMASPGDRVIVTKGCAIEATAIAAQLFPKRLMGQLEAMESAEASGRGEETPARGEERPESPGARFGGATAAFDRARASLDQVTVVPDCRAALRAGLREEGVTALHDATEGGVLGGLVELASACGHGLRVRRAGIPLSPEARAACAVFGIDPWWTLSEGALIACARPGRAGAVLEELERDGITAAEVGEVVAAKGEAGRAAKDGGGGLMLVEPDGRETRIERAEPDPYWAAYARAVREGWE
ncbi:MAG: AIR synthase-related protein [Candidatus Eisenbacteria bacterium]